MLLIPWPRATPPAVAAIWLMIPPPEEDCAGGAACCVGCAALTGGVGGTAAPLGRKAEFVGAAIAGAGAAMELAERVCATGDGLTDGAEGRERVQPARAQKRLTKPLSAGTYRAELPRTRPAWKIVGGKILPHSERDRRR